MSDLSTNAGLGWAIIFAALTTTMVVRSLLARRHSR